MINETDRKNEDLRNAFNLLQTHMIVLSKEKKNEKSAFQSTASNILPREIMMLIGLQISAIELEPLKQLMALIAFVQQKLNFNADEIININNINRTLADAMSMNWDAFNTIPHIYNATFTSIIELIGNRKEELLRQAAQTGNELAVVQLLKIVGIDVNAKDNKGWTALMRAAQDGHAPVVTELLKVNGIAVNAIGYFELTALMLAAFNGSSSVVTALLSVDCIKVNGKSIDGWTALMRAAIKGHMSIMHQLCVKQLLDAPLVQGNALFLQLTNEIESANDSMTINPASICGYFLKSVEALPTADEKITLLEKALSKQNAFSAVMTEANMSRIQNALDALQAKDKGQPVRFSASMRPGKSTLNLTNTSCKLM